MGLEAHIALVAAWLNSVEVESAPARIDEALERNLAKEAAALSGLSAASSGEIELAALHEAAHACVAHRLGLDVGRTCVRADASGTAAYTASEARADTMLSLALAALGGAIAELLIGADDRRQFELSHSYDILDARTTLSRCLAHAPDWTLSSRTLATLACCSVVSNWSSILRVAGALRACRELDGASIAALCGKPQ
jgi:hypothetical protein